VPTAKPVKFRRRAVELARSGQQRVTKIAADLGICRRRVKNDPLVPLVVSSRRHNVDGVHRVRAGVKR